MNGQNLKDERKRKVKVHKHKRKEKLDSLNYF